MAIWTLAIWTYHLAAQGAPDDQTKDVMAGPQRCQTFGCLRHCCVMLHHREWAFCVAFDDALAGSGIHCLTVPPPGSNLSAFAERSLRSVKEECRSKLILFGAGSLCPSVEYVDRRWQVRFRMPSLPMLLKSRGAHFTDWLCAGGTGEIGPTCAFPGSRAASESWNTRPISKRSTRPKACAMNGLLQPGHPNVAKIETIIYCFQQARLGSY